MQTHHHKDTCQLKGFSLTSKQEKATNYNSRRIINVEHGMVTALAASVSEGMARECSTFRK